MPSPSLPTGAGAPAETPRGKGWVFILAVVLAFVAWDTTVRWRHIRQVTSSYGVTVDAPPPEASSPTGYAQGRRSLILPDRDMDGYHWIMQAQAAAAADTLRVRHVDYDGAPGGREVHWAAPFRWWILLLARVDRAFTDAPEGIAIERAAVLSGPVLLAAWLLLFAPLIASRCSRAAACLVAVGIVATLPCYVDFVAGYADHHGLVNLCALMSVLFLAQASRSIRSARLWVLAGAAAGGLGLWISAATQIPVLVGLGVAGVAACWIGRGPEPGNVWTRQPALFRSWGKAGALVSVAAWLFEYFPHHLGLRLEVNHPVYALAWLAGGEALCRLARIASGASPVPRRRNYLLGGLAAAGVAAVPVLIYLTRGTTFHVADGFLWRLHHDFIAEFQLLPDYLVRRAGAWEAWTPLLPLGVLVLAVREYRREPRTRSALTVALAPALVVLPLMISQVRWWGLECMLLLPVIVVLLQPPPAPGSAGTTPPHTSPPVSRPRWTGLTAVLITLLYLPGAIAAVRQTLQAGTLTEDDIHALAERDLAHWLRLHAGTERVVLTASPTVTTSLVFHGGLTGVGTLYWENMAGLKSAAELYAAPTDEAARAVVRRCGITHIVVVSWDGFEGVYARLARGTPASESIPADTFIVRLLSAPVAPAWLRPVPFQLPSHAALSGQEVRIFAVTPEQTPLAALEHTASYLLEMGRVDEAQTVAPGLVGQNTDAAAVALLAELASRRGDRGAFLRAIETLATLVPTKPELPLEDRVRMVAVLAAAERFDLARAELDRALRQTTAAELRNLPTGALMNLLTLSEVAGAEWPDATLKMLATSLVPPNRRR